MKLDLLNTARGLIPLYDEGYDEKKKLRIGQIYRADIRVPRNTKFHNKAFALVNAAWSLMDEGQIAAWRSKEGFRDYLTVASGHYNVYYNPRLREFVETPKSWSFDSMDEAEFNDLYDRMLDTIYAILGDKVTPEIFQTVLANF